MKRKWCHHIIWIFALSLLILVSACSSKENTDAIKLAALLPMSGELGSKGEVRKLALEKGLEAANETLQESGIDAQFDLTVEDSESDPEVVLEKAKQLWEDGHKIFISGSSAEVESLQSWADEQGAIVISYSSSSPALGIEGDGIFRMVPDDTEQVKALASLLEYEGMYGIVPVYREDIYGSEFVKMLTEEFEALHGIVSEPISYSPQEADWENIVEQVSQSVESLQINQEGIAIVMIAFDEVAEMLKVSEQQENITDVRWFGTDSVTLSPVILEDEVIAEIASEVNLTGVTFGIPDSALFESLQTELETAMEEQFLPDALFAYDIPGMLATVMNQMEDPFDMEELKATMLEGSANFAGVTGWTVLNEKGDRNYYHYDVWKITDGADAYVWEKTAKYLRNPGVPGFITPYEE